MSVTVLEETKTRHETASGTRRSSTSAFDFPVVFVAERLHSRWRDLVASGQSPRIEDLPPTRFLVLEDIWIISTYLRLRQAGYAVEIASRPQDGAINIACSARVQLAAPLRSGVMVAIRADRARQTWGDLNLVQNPTNIEGTGDWLIDHWPQPNIIPRDPDRCDRIERVGILSPLFSVAPELRATQFREELASRGFELVVRSDGAQWNDYSDLDVQIAFRNSPMVALRTKPATKIVQAWIARCPAITGVEPCFRAVGRPGSDYLEASSARGIIDALIMLRARPDVYRSLIANGSRKAPLHDEASVLQQWVDFLKGPATEAMRDQAIVGARGAIGRLMVQASVLTSVMRHRLLMRWVRIRATRRNPTLLPSHALSRE